MRHSFHAEQWVARPTDEVFAFFAHPENLPRIMPGWQRARIDRARLVPPPAPLHEGPTEGIAGAGSEMTISFRPVPLSPVRQSWVARIVDFAWNQHFCDEQIAGPFSYWRHCHRVHPSERDGVRGTLIVDDLVYAPPLGTLGDVANAVCVHRQILALFRYRQRMVEKLLGADAHRAA